MQFILCSLLFLSDKIEKTKIKIVKRSVTKTKAFYLQRSRVGSNDGFPHKKYEIPLLGSRAVVLRKTPPRKRKQQCGEPDFLDLHGF